MSRVLPAAGVVFDAAISVAVVGGGAAGACAALAAAEAGAEVVILERDALPRGSTALSAGLVPAAGTRFQRACGIADDADGFAADIQRKAGGAADPAIVALVSRQAGPTIEWLADAHGLPFSVVDDFDYPGHGARRMHGLPSRAGAELIDRLQRAVEAAGVPVVTGATVDTLYADPDGRIRGIGYGRPDGTRETLAADAVVLACNGYGGDPDLVRQHIPEMDGALYFGHPGNRGDAVRWGEALGASLRFMSGYQGHGSVAHPHGILITWAVIMEGGFQVDATGRRFSDEEERAGAAVCIIGETVRREIYGGAVGLNGLGELLRVKQFSCTVIGILASKGQAAMGNDQDDTVLLPLHTRAAATWSGCFFSAAVGATRQMFCANSTANDCASSACSKADFACTPK